MSTKQYKSLITKELNNILEQLPRLDMLLAISLGLTIIGFIILQFCSFFSK
jgi:hypothetical protein